MNIGEIYIEQGGVGNHAWLFEIVSVNPLKGKLLFCSDPTFYIVKTGDVIDLHPERGNLIKIK